MKKFYFTLTGLFLMALTLLGQRYLTPEGGQKVAYFSPEVLTVQTFDVSLQYFYYSDGLNIYQVDPLLAIATNTYPKPADYNVNTFPSFLNVSADESSIWAGYTNLDNSDSRIYRIDVESGIWFLEAKMPSNWDMIFWGDSILVSGLNNVDYATPGGIFVLDTTGSDLHRKIVETGGNSAGLAVDALGNLYYGTSSLTEANALYRWSNTDVAAVVGSIGATPLTLADAVKLADIPMGAYDCEVDAGGHVIFTMNEMGGTQVLAQWNGTPGDGPNYDTLAVSAEWLGMLKSRGDYTVPTLGNSLYILGYGQSVADLHSSDYHPLLTAPLPVITGYESGTIDPIDLTAYFTDLDDPEGMTFEITVMSDESVAALIVDGNSLSGTFGLAGQSNLVVEATSGGMSVTGNTLVGSWPNIEGETVLSDFEDLTLAQESYWNGSDGTGNFSSGLARFYNEFNAEYFSWSGWAHSNTSDVTTPGFTNQYSAITGEGFDSGDDSNGIYGVSSRFGPVMIDFPEKAYAPEGFYVTNSTYATLSMEQGDWAAKQFGGDDGTDPDYFMLSVWGFSGSESTDTIEYYLADYRFNEPENDYIIKTWQWVDLSSFGKVDSLHFGLESSDVGEWGMNTPAYFCMDNLHLLPDAAPFVANPIPDMNIANDGVEHLIDLSGVFSDPDDDDTMIVKVLLSENTEAPLKVSISGDELSIQTYAPAKSTFEDFEIVVEGSLGGLSAVDTFIVHLEFVGDAAPYVANPLPDMDIVADGTGQVVDLSEVFSDPDDEDSLIVKTLLSENTEAPLMVSISGDELSIQTFGLTKSTFEDFEIVVEGSLRGLSAVDTFTITLELIDGLENSPAAEIELYPNPTDGRFMIAFSTAEELDVSIYDITGTEVYCIPQLLSGQGVDISSQPSGAYIIRIRHSSGVISKMIQKL
ncbi:MAG: DUF4465 domain-containing protein [Bacteroidetes bacterium]|nr:DUF4465 domain-containing protein [Bacteroidota bacterium]